MIKGLHSAALGVKTQQHRINTIADNLANTNTAGFKASRMDFKDAMYGQMKLQATTQLGNNLQVGHGTLVGAATVNFTDGNIQNTGDLLDFAISGDGFFAIRGADGNIRYTRNGAFSVSTGADGEYLTAGNGEYVLDVNGSRIRLDGDVEKLSVTQDGRLFFGENEQSFAQLNIVKFANPEGLVGVGQTSFVPSVASGPARPAGNAAKVQQGVLEDSNVDLSEEITILIRTQRALQLASRGITVADEMESIANNMRR